MSVTERKPPAMPVLPSVASRLATLAYRASINPMFTAGESQAAADRAAAAQAADRPAQS